MISPCVILSTLCHKIVSAALLLLPIFGLALPDCQEWRSLMLSQALTTNYSLGLFDLYQAGQVDTETIIWSGMLTRTWPPRIRTRTRTWPPGTRTRTWPPRTCRTRTWPPRTRTWPPRTKTRTPRTESGWW